MAKARITGKRTRIQREKRRAIFEAALDVFSEHGLRGATLEQIAAAAGLSKPNIVYYFEGKDAIYVELLESLLDVWLNPLRELSPDGNPMDEILGYVRRKLEMSREFPRESRLFATEIIQGAPRIHPVLQEQLKTLVDEKAAVIAGWSAAGQIAPLDPRHLIFSIWSVTQHYADFDSQVTTLLGPEATATRFQDADRFAAEAFRRMLTP